MMESNTSTPLPLTIPKTESATSEDVGLASAVLRRLVTFKPTNPLPGVTNLKTFGLSLKKEAPKLLDPRGYSKPSSFEQALSRVRANISFFRVTYTAVCGSVVVLFILSNPTLFIFTLLLTALWAAFLSQPPDHVIKLGSVELKKNEKTVILASLTVLVVVFGGLISSALYIVFVSGAIISTHGAFREPIVLDALEQLEQEGESLVKGDVV